MSERVERMFYAVNQQMADDLRDGGQTKELNKYLYPAIEALITTSLIEELREVAEWWNDPNNQKPQLLYRPTYIRVERGWHLILMLVTLEVAIPFSSIVSRLLAGSLFCCTV